MAQILGCTLEALLEDQAGVMEDWLARCPSGEQPSWEVEQLSELFEDFYCRLRGYRDGFDGSVGTTPPLKLSEASEKDLAKIEDLFFSKIKITKVSEGLEDWDFDVDPPFWTVAGWQNHLDWIAIRARAERVLAEIKACYHDW